MTVGWSRCSRSRDLRLTECGRCERIYGRSRHSEILLCWWWGSRNGEILLSRRCRCRHGKILLRRGSCKWIGWGSRKITGTAELIISRLGSRRGDRCLSGCHCPAVIRSRSCPLVGLSTCRSQCKFIIHGSLTKRIPSGIEVVHEINQEVCGLSGNLGFFKSIFSLGFSSIFSLERSFDGFSQICLLLVRIMGCLDLSNITLLSSTRTSAVLDRWISTSLLRPPLATIMTNRLAPGQAQSINLGKTEETPPVNKEVVLPKPRVCRHGSRSMSHHLKHVIPPHRPTKINHGTPRVRIMDLLPVCQNQSFSRSDTPDERDIVFFPTAGRTGFARRESVGVGKAEAPADATLGVGNAFSACDGGEVNRIERAVPAARGVRGVAGASGGHDEIVPVVFKNRRCREGGMQRE
mmetsp:Transcript_10553/g.22787  ORF Transcript_10553/g.22787 Transcript_10553/m.22787 type:complete len:407 (+) Transcript_10553:1137-2357(+)